MLVNGGVNLSELDGWWARPTPQVGWALGDGQEHGDDPAWDAVEADALYERLEREVIPEFYARDEQGIPTAWVARMRESMARLTPRFSANRTVREYTEQHYLPAQPPTICALPTKAQSAGKLSLGGTLWNRNGPRYTSENRRLRLTRSDIFQAEVYRTISTRMRCESSSMLMESKAALRCGRR